MGTSGAYKGSGGKAGKDLHNVLTEWLDDENLENLTPSSDLILPILGLWKRTSGGGEGLGGGGGGGERGGTGKPRSDGGVQRAVSKIALPAGRAVSLTHSYLSGDKAAVEAAGLNYEDLKSLDNPLEISRLIAQAAFESHPDGSIEDIESRLIVVELTRWMMNNPEITEKHPGEIVRKIIEILISRTMLTEVGDMIRQQSSSSKRQQAEQMIKETAKSYAARLSLDDSGIKESEIADAIKEGIDQLSEIFGAEK